MVLDYLHFPLSQILYASGPLISTREIHERHNENTCRFHVGLACQMPTWDPICSTIRRDIFQPVSLISYRLDRPKQGDGTCRRILTEGWCSTALVCWGDEE